MIDTVVLEFHESLFKIDKDQYGEFSPNIRNFLHPPFINLGKNKFAKATRNPTKEDYQQTHGEYLPRLTIYRSVRNSSIATFLYVEFSAPKIVFNNNFDELDDSLETFDYLCECLRRKLLYLGVHIDIFTIKRAAVRKIHYSKNIILTDYTTASSIIRDISMCDAPNNKQTDIQRYENGGSAVHISTNEKGIVFYDKIAEMNRAKKTTKDLKETDYDCQLDLFDDIDLPKPFEVLRIERRYEKSRAIRDALKEIGEDPGRVLSFDKLFSADIAKKLLMKEFNTIRAKYPTTILSDNMANSISDLRIKNQKASLLNILAVVGYSALLNSGVTPREIRKLICATPQQWSRLNKMLRSIDMTKMEHPAFKHIETALDEFKPERLENYTSNTKGDDI